MQVQCAWCKLRMPDKEPLADRSVSHTICKSCAVEVKASVSHRREDLQSNPERVTMEGLWALVRLLKSETEYNIDFDLESVNGRLRLVSHKGSRDVSPRLSKSELHQWIHAFLDGIQVGKALR